MANKMTRSQALDRLKALRDMLDQPDADIEAIEEEIQQLEEILSEAEEAVEEIAEEAADAAEGDEEARSDEDPEEEDEEEERPEERVSILRRRAQARARLIAAGGGRVSRNFKNLEGKPMNKAYDAASKEYRSAWLKNAAVVGENRLLGDLTETEKRAFTFTTQNSGSVVPTETLNRIVELVESMSPMLDDANPSAMTKGFGVPRHASIEAGDAAVTSEGAANSDEEDAFNLLELAGVEIKKHANVTRKMAFQSIDAFEDWLVQHLAERIAVAKEGHIISRLNNVTYGIAAANKLQNQLYTEGTIRAIFGAIKGQGEIKVYANRYTIWNGLAGIQTGDGKYAFISSGKENPEVEGLLFGASVRRDENLANNVAYFGIPARLLVNNFDPLTVERDKDVKTFVTTIGAYSLFDAGLEDPLSWVKVEFTGAGSISAITVSSAAGSTSGKTALTLTGYTPAQGEAYLYKTAEGAAPAAVYGATPDYTWTAWNGSSQITATTGHKITVVSVNADGKIVAAGTATVTSKA